MRKLYEVASDIQTHWKKVNYGAVPYLEAMSCLSSIDDNYGCDDGRSIVAYFLSNATSFRGEHARRLKAELKSMLG